jgi:hypothetical protein
MITVTSGTRREVDAPTACDRSAKRRIEAARRRIVAATGSNATQFWHLDRCRRDHAPRDKAAGDAGGSRRALPYLVRLIRVQLWLYGGRRVQRCLSRRRPYAGTEKNQGKTRYRMNLSTDGGEAGRQYSPN